MRRLLVVYVAAGFLVTDWLVGRLNRALCDRRDAAEALWRPTVDDLLFGEPEPSPWEAP